MLLKIIIIVSLIKTLMATGNVKLCVGVYTACYFLLGLTSVFSGNVSFLILAGATVLVAVLSTVYFGLLDRFEDGGWYYVILLAGLPLVFI